LFLVILLAVFDGGVGAPSGPPNILDTPVLLNLGSVALRVWGAGGGAAIGKEVRGKEGIGAAAGTAVGWLTCSVACAGSTCSVVWGSCSC